MTKVSKNLILVLAYSYKLLSILYLKNLGSQLA